MASISNIEWTDATWNPIVGCTIVSPGCVNCYAMRDSWRKNFNPATPHYKGLTKQVNGNIVWTGSIARAPDHIFHAPLHWKKPRRIFVNSMGDLFHESIADKDIDEAFAVMALSPQHTFQVLTKRAERMREYLTTPYRHDQIGDAMIEVGDIQPGFKCVSWPLPNVWLGVSAERQHEWDERTAHLRKTPAAIRFVSVEPMLGPVVGTPETMLDLDWIIDGGESGANARVYAIAASRALERQCRDAGVAYFRKQLGARPFEREPSGWPSHVGLMPDGFGNYYVHGLKSKKGGDWSEWPEDLRVREFPVRSQSRSEAA